MRPKSLLLLFLALGCGLIASIGISQVMGRKGEDTNTNTGETTPVLVSLAEIPLGDTISAAAVKLEPWPKSKVPQGAFTNIEDIEGRRARYPIPASSPIFESMLIGDGESTNSAIDLIPKGYRVIAVKVSVDSGANLINPGDRVDMMVYIRRADIGGTKKTIAKTFLTDIKVFAVNNQYRRPDQTEEEAVAAKTVSLLVTPVQAEEITLASEIGKIRLTMRHHDDHAESETHGAEAADLLNADKSDPDEEKGALASNDKKKGSSLTDFLNNTENENKTQTPVVVGPPKDLWVMEIINGSDITEIQFDGDKPIRDGQQGSSNTPPYQGPNPHDPGANNGPSDGPQGGADQPQETDS